MCNGLAASQYETLNCIFRRLQPLCFFRPSGHGRKMTLVFYEKARGLSGSAHFINKVGKFPREFIPDLLSFLQFKLILANTLSPARDVLTCLFELAPAE